MKSLSLVRNALNVQCHGLLDFCCENSLNRSAKCEAKSRRVGRLRARSTTLSAALSTSNIRRTVPSRHL